MKALKLLALVFVVTLLLAAPALAQPGADARRRSQRSLSGSSKSAWASAPP